MAPDGCCIGHPHRPMNHSKRKRILELQAEEERFRLKFPELQPTIREIVLEVASWPEVERSNYVYGGTEFRIFNRNVGHIHSNGLLDLPFKKQVRDLVIDHGMADWHHFGKKMMWVSVKISASEDFHKVRPLLLLSCFIKAKDYFQHFPELEHFLRQEINQLQLPLEILQTAGYLHPQHEP